MEKKQRTFRTGEGERADMIFDNEGNYICSCAWPYTKGAPKLLKRDIKTAEALVKLLNMAAGVE